MEKIKIKVATILPYWLIAVILLISVQITFSVTDKKNTADTVLQNEQIKPQVLGASTSNITIRGQTQVQDSIEQISVPNTSDIKAKSFLAFDLVTGQNLLAENIDEKLGIASLTKLMTGLVAYQNSDLNGSTTISGKDTLNIRPVVGFLPGDKIKVLDIFNSMLIGSCNDAALALSNYVNAQTGNNFVNLMNEQAKQLGMDGTSYDNPIGFDSKNNYSTAKDLKILITKTQSLSVFKDLGRRTDYKFSGDNDNGHVYYVKATNKLIKNHPDILAIKTGFTDEAGGAMATKAIINGHEVVILVLDSPNRELDTLNLKKALTQDFKWQ